MTDASQRPDVRDGTRDRTALARAGSPAAALYRSAGSPLLAIALAGSLWFANETNAGKFWDRLPHFFDFFGDMIPRDGWEIWRAMFDLESPYADGSR
jgi:ABC-type phosphate/phosphonate transport system permease subunit